MSGKGPVEDGLSWRTRTNFVWQRNEMRDGEGACPASWILTKCSFPDSEVGRQSRVAPHGRVRAVVHRVDTPRRRHVHFPTRWQQS